MLTVIIFIGYIYLSLLALGLVLKVITFVLGALIK